MSTYRIIGWTALSIIIFFLLFVLLQWITFEVLHFDRLTHNILLFLLYGIGAYLLPKNYGVIGASVMAFFLLALMILTNNLSYEHIVVSLIMIFGGAFGVFVRRRNYIYFLAILPFTVILLYFANSKYASAEFTTVEPTDKLSINIINQSNKNLVNMFGDRLKLSGDTVYLVNFSFYACLPCRQKKPVLHQLEEKFANRPFKVVYIHSFEPKEVYLEYYKNEPGTYHDSGQILQKKLKISGAPFELLFDKSGNEIRRLEGFNSEYRQDYLDKSIDLVRRSL